MSTGGQGRNTRAESACLTSSTTTADSRAGWHEYLVTNHFTARAAEIGEWLTGDQYGTHLGDSAGSGLRWQKPRTWCETGQVARKRKRGVVMATIRMQGKKELIDMAYREGEKMGLATWVEDEAGPYQRSLCGESWQPESQPVHQPHEYIRNGTAKMLTLFHPASGPVRVKGVTQSTNAILHPDQGPGGRHPQNAP